MSCLGQVARVFLERIVTVFRALAYPPFFCREAARLRQEFRVLRRQAGLGKRVADVSASPWPRPWPGVDAFNRYVIVAGLLRHLLGLVEDADRVAVDARCLTWHRFRLRLAPSKPKHRLRAGRSWHRRPRPGSVPPPCPARHRVALEQMSRRDALMMLADRNRLRGLQESRARGRSAFRVHSSLYSPVLGPGYGVAHRQHKSASPSLTACQAGLGLCYRAGSRLVGARGRAEGGVASDCSRAITSPAAAGSVRVAKRLADASRHPPGWMIAGHSAWRLPGPCSSDGTWCYPHESEGKRRNRARRCTAHHVRSGSRTGFASISSRVIGRNGTMSIAEYCLCALSGAPPAQILSAGLR